MLRAAALATVVAALLPTAATAKEVTRAAICGAGGCAVVDAVPGTLTYGGAGDPVAPPPVSPYYSLRLEIDGHPSAAPASLFWIPASGVVASRDDFGRTTFERLTGPTLEAFEAAAGGVEPYPAPSVTSGTVGETMLRDPGSYLELFSRPPNPDAYPDAADWLPIELSSREPSPWTNAQLLTFSPATLLVATGMSYVSLDDGEAAAVLAGDALPADASSDVLARVAIGLTAAAALALLALGVRRRRVPRVASGLERPATWS